jgi:hypothetical protein
METKNSKRELKCKGGGTRETIIDKGFGYINFKEPDDGTYTPDLSELSAIVKDQKKAQAIERKDHVFLNDIATEFQLDRSNLRRFAIKHKIPMCKIAHPIQYQPCLAFTKKDAKRLIKLKFGG